MDPAKIMFIQRPLLKREPRRFYKNPHVPHPARALRGATSCSFWQLGKELTMATQLCLWSLIHYIQLLARSYEQIWNLLTIAQ
jgi:hypothetical protein